MIRDSSSKLSTAVDFNEFETEIHYDVWGEYEGDDTPHAIDDLDINEIAGLTLSDTVLKDMTLSLAPRTRHALMGASGIGKTTLLRIAAGLEEADSGTVFSPASAFVFQEDRLSGDLSAIGNARLGARDVTAAQAAGMLSLLGLEGHLDKPVRELSGGMRRRVAIARALLSPAPLLLLDEPFKGLDEETREKTARVITEYAKEKTLLLVTHDEREAALLSAEIITL